MAYTVIKLEEILAHKNEKQPPTPIRRLLIAKLKITENHIMKRKQLAVPTTRSNILDFIHSADEFFATPDLSDLLFFDFTSEVSHTKRHTSDVLPLPRGGDFLQRYDLINAPVMGEDNEVDYWVTGIIESWGHGMVVIIDNNNVRHYTTFEAVEEAAELIAAAVTDAGFIKLEQELIDYVSNLETAFAA
jgi:hypothetical protein